MEEKDRAISKQYELSAAHLTLTMRHPIDFPKKFRHIGGLLTDAFPVFIHATP